MTSLVRYSILSGILLLSLTQTTLKAQPERKPAEFDRYITHLMDSVGIPGLSIAIIRDNKVAYSKGYGLTRKDSTQRVSSSTIFEAASLTKPVFAYAVLQLVEEGLLDLDKPLYTYLPYPDAANDERYEKITARLVLSHQSGFPNWRKNRRAPELAMSFTPGERFGYSGEGFVYLQKVVEKLTGKPINTFMEERVLKPLAMTNSGFVWKPVFDANVALPHDESGEAGQKYKPQEANMAYSLQTTAGDYAKFVQAILTQKGLKAATISQMLSPQSQLPTRFGGDTLSTSLYWGLGFGLEKTPQGTLCWHWGDNGAFKCYVTANPAQKSAYVYFTNSSWGLALIGELTQRLMNYTPTTGSFLGGSPVKKVK